MASTIEVKKRRLDGDEEAPVAKRGRGRPRKSNETSAPPPADPNTPKRGRGRPRKVADTSLPPPTNSNTPKRGRGRPRKDADASASKGQQKPRGRPKKSNATADKATSSASTKKVAKASSKSDALLQSITGTYDISCEAVEDGWDDMSEDMSMSITTLPHTNSTLIASFDLGILEGTMLLAADKDTLEATSQNMKKGNSNRDNKSKAPTLQNGSVHFMWRGRETSESQAYPGSYGDQVGIIRFKGGKWASFEGEGSFPMLGSKCKFTGKKVDEKTYDVPEPWNNFDEEAYEEANRSRW